MSAAIVLGAAVLAAQGVVAIAAAALAAPQMIEPRRDGWLLAGIAAAGGALLILAITMLRQGVTQ